MGDTNIERGELGGSGNTTEPPATSDFAAGTKTIRQWLNHQTVSTDRLADELRHWADHFAPTKPGAIRVVRRVETAPPKEPAGDEPRMPLMSTTEEP